MSGLSRDARGRLGLKGIWASRQRRGSRRKLTSEKKKETCADLKLQGSSIHPPTSTIVKHPRSYAALAEQPNSKHPSTSTLQGLNLTPALDSTNNEVANPQHRPKELP